MNICKCLVLDVINMSIYFNIFLGNVDVFLKRFHTFNSHPMAIL